MPTDHPRVADYLVAQLAAAGVRHVFGVGGANIEDIYDAVHTGGRRIQAVVAKHEFAAACMAEGYRRVTGGVGVMMATSGGGAMNLVPGIAEAYAARVPVLALIGQPPRDLEGRGAFQDTSGRAGAFDAVRLFSSISRYCVRVDDPSTVDDALATALDVVRGPLGGPAILLLPKDVQQARVAGLRPVRELTGEPYPVPAPGRRPAADLLRSAATGGSDVLVIAGDGVNQRGLRAEVAELAHRLGATVAVTPEARDAFDNTDPCFVGVTGAIGHPSVVDQLANARLVVLIGTRLPVMARAGMDQALAGIPVVCFDAEPPFLSADRHGAPVVHVGHDLRAELRAAIDAVPMPGYRRAPGGHASGGVRHLVVPDRPTAGVRLADAVTAIRQALPAGSTVVSDAGNASAAAIHYLPLSPGGNFILAQGMGAMGHSFGAGIGAAFGTGRRTYVLSGDGGFYAHGMELHTAVEYRLPITFVIFNNNAHAMCVTREQLYYAGDYSYNTFQPADIAAGVRAMFPGLAATHASTADQLRDALLAGNASAGPALVCVDSDPHETPPFVPFLHQLAVPTAAPGAAHVEHVAPVG